MQRVYNNINELSPSLHITDDEKKQKLLLKCILVQKPKRYMLFSAKSAHNATSVNAMCLDVLKNI